MNNAVENITVSPGNEGQAAYSFGQRLQTARRALNMSRQDVARELRLGLDIITALEEEDFDSLGAPIFVCGYLKNYTKLVKIPSEPVLAAYSQVQVESPRLIADTIQPQSGTFSKILVRLASLLIILTLVAGLVSWYQSSDFSFFNSESNLAEAEQQPAVIAPLPEVSPEAETAEAVIESPTELPAVETEEVAEIVETAETVESSPPSVSEVSHQAEPEVVAVLDAPPVAPAVEGAELALVFYADSWTEVTDRDGKRLIYDLLRSGTVKTVHGRPPFSVFVGNASGVEIKYNGALYDFSAFTSKNLARFELGDKGDE